MINNNKKVKLQKSEIIAAIGTVIFHIIVLLFLLFNGFASIIPKEEEGIEVMFGIVDNAQGMIQPRNTGHQKIRHTPPPPPTKPASQEKAKEELIEQKDNSVHIPSEKEKLKQKEAEKQKKELERKKAEEKARKKAQEEKARKEAAKKAIEKAKKEAIKKKMSGAFGSGTRTNSKKGNTTGEGSQGNPFGLSEKGVKANSNGWGEFSLSGRSLGKEGLKRPDYKIQEEGTIVVDIIVNTQGKVITAMIGKGTTINNSVMKKACIKAAKQTFFNSIKKTNNQNGFITYKFSLK